MRPRYGESSFRYAPFRFPISRWCGKKSTASKKAYFLLLHTAGSVAFFVRNHGCLAIFVFLWYGISGNLISVAVLLSVCVPEILNLIAENSHFALPVTTINEEMQFYRFRADKNRRNAQKNQVERLYSYAKLHVLFKLTAKIGVETLIPTQKFEF